MNCRKKFQSREIQVIFIIHTRRTKNRNVKTEFKHIIQNCQWLDFGGGFKIFSYALVLLVNIPYNLHLCTERPIFISALYLSCKRAQIYQLFGTQIRMAQQYFVIQFLSNVFLYPSIFIICSIFIFKQQNSYRFLL